MSRLLNSLKTAFIFLAALLLPILGWEPATHSALPWVVGIFALIVALSQPPYVPGEATATDQGTARAFALATVIYLPMVMLEARFRVGPGSMQFGAPAAVGLAILTAGVLLRAWAVRTLGQFFTLHVQVTHQQPVIRSGPYRWVRHPSYTGGLMIILGFATTMSAWIMLLVGAALFVTLFIRRIHVEERALVATLGDPYRDYQKTTAALIPGFGKR